MIKQIFLSLVITASIFGCVQNSDESAAIKKLLEKESATWRSGDIQGHADCWHIQPYSRIIVSRDDGSVLDVPPDAMIHPAANMLGQGGSSINSNYKMNVTGNNAWVSHNEESTSKDGKKQYSYEFRILEKINGQWKLVAQSIHIYKPK
jgi:hypothetical protein